MAVEFRARNPYNHGVITPMCVSAGVSERDTCWPQSSFSQANPVATLLPFRDGQRARPHNRGVARASQIVCAFAMLGPSYARVV